MIEEVISEIIAAEQTAEKIKADAEEQATAIVAEAEKRAADTKNATAARVKARKIKRGAEADEKAVSAFKSVTDEARAKADEIIESGKAASKKAGNEIYRRIINGDC